MTQSRAAQVSLDDTPYYHCICRCVRRAFLCGVDHYSGHDYEHRRQWVADRLALLVEVFAVDLCAYAVMSNHCHLVLRVDRDKALAWTEREVVDQWLKLFSCPELVKRWLDGMAGSAEAEQVLAIISSWRTRLYDLGWFMKCLNEHLARKANEEEGCKGRFWESRYKSQALLDEQALLRCMAYVDLNPVRAGLARTPETSEYTSVQQRCDTLSADNGSASPASARPRLLPLITEEDIEAEDHKTLCRIRCMDYLQLVDSTGRALRVGKRGAIDQQAMGILDRLGIDHTAWLLHMAPRRRLPVASGAVVRLQAFAASTGRRWVSGYRLACW